MRILDDIMKCLMMVACMLIIGIDKVRKLIGKD